METEMFAFIDTNILLHFKPVNQIDWCKFLNVRSVVLVICMPVIDELDAKKNDPRLGDRASRAIKEIDRFGIKSESVRTNVCMQIYQKSLAPADSATGILPDSQDDRIVLLVNKFKQAHPDRNVCIVSEDFGMKVRASANSVLVQELDRAERLQNPGDEKDKQIKSLQSELSLHKNRQPKLCVVLLPRGQTVNDRATFSTTMTKTWIKLDVDEEVEKQRRNYTKHSDPKKPFLSPGTFAFDRNIKAEDWARYDKSIDHYLSNYRTFVEAKNAWHESNDVTMKIGVVLHNDGSSPATDIDLYLELPNTLERLYDMSKSGPKEPEPPRSPQRPNGLERLASSLGTHASRSGLSMSPFYGVRQPEPPIEHAPNLPEVSIHYRYSYGHLIRIKLKKLKHGDFCVLGLFSVGFRNWDEVSPCQIDYTCSANELVTRNEGIIPLLIEKSDGTAM